MRVAIDYTPAIRQAAGIGRLTRHLIRQVVRSGPDHQYILFMAGHPGADSGELVGWPAHVRLRPTLLPERFLTILWHRIRVPLSVERFLGACDIFHSTDFVLPPVSRARTLLTVHDLSFVRCPECAHPNLRSYLSAVVPRSLARADRVIADSDATRQDLVELLGVQPEKTAVVHGGVEERFCPASPSAAHDEAALKRYHLDRPYLLALGTIEPRKNYVRLIQAYHALLADEPDLPILAIAGGRGWLYEGIYAEAERRKLGDRLRFLGFVDDCDLPALYRGASLFVFPSLYEGFGLPPLEAMACGCPVVCSDGSSLPEVVGDAAVRVNPLDVDALAGAMGQLLSDTALRHTLAERGLRQAGRFTWERAARRLLEEYERLAGAS